MQKLKEISPFHTAEQIEPITCNCQHLAASFVTHGSPPFHLAMGDGLCYLIGFIQRENNPPVMFVSGGSSTTWSQVPIEVRLPQKSGLEDVTSLDVYIPKGWLLGP